MKIGYPCINESLDCTSSATFRLASYSEERLLQTVDSNLKCLRRILEYNVAHNLLFFRISSGLVPFASHAVNTFNWQAHFRQTFQELGAYIRQHNMRISMHPDQFVVLNSPKPETIRNAVAELVYQGSVLDLMELDETAKLQIHVGGAYGNKPAAIEKFAETYHKLLPEAVRRRLVVENDDRLFSLQDCLNLHEKTGVPILFDNFHHECNNNGEPMREAVLLAAQTWQAQDGPLMIDYSSQAPGERKGKHVASIEEDLFREFIQVIHGIEADIMLEIKNKEASAHRACIILRELNRL